MVQYNPEEDGITHINIHSKGKTELGRLLSNFAHTPFWLQGAGRFESVEGYWFWLHTGNELLREMHGFQAKKYGSMLTRSQLPSDDFEVFKDSIKKAFIAKLDQNQNVLDLFLESELPFTHYYVYGEKVVIPKQHQWQVDFWESYRKELKEGLYGTTSGIR